MRITYIAAGAAGMYCGSCIHDNTLAAALVKKGHEVALVPTYTPLRTDEKSVSVGSVFYGAINVYLQQKSALFRRRVSGLLDRVLDAPRLIQYASRLGSATNARDLGALTVSMLRGEEGYQRKELYKLVRWLEEFGRPDVVQLTNSMFLGLAREIKRRLGVPVLCTLQGEDIFLEELAEPFKSEAKSLLRIRAEDADGFVATSAFYADFMSDYLGVTRDKIHVVPLGINLSGHGILPKSPPGSPTTIGYLARICPEKGLHLLVQSFELLVQRIGKDGIRLEVAGFLGSRDRAYFDEIMKEVSRSNWQSQFRYWGELDRRRKLEFLSSLDLLSVPTLYQDPKGLFVLEALANEVAVVQPAHGSFPELIEMTGGGKLVEPESASSLADELQHLVENAEERKGLARQGKIAVNRLFNDEVLAERMLAVYRKYL